MELRVAPAAVRRATVSAQSRGCLAARPPIPRCTVAAPAPPGPPTANPRGPTIRTAAAPPASQLRPLTASYPRPNTHCSDLWSRGDGVLNERR